MTAFLLVWQGKNAWKIWSVRQDALQLVAFSIAGLLFCQYAYLTAVQYTNAGTATVIEYINPVLVMAIVCLKHRRMPSHRELLSIVLMVTGIFLLATHGNPFSMALSRQGLAWGLLAAMGATVYMLLSGRIIRKWSSLAVTGWGMLLGGVILSLGIRIWTIPVHLDGKELLALAGVIVLGTIVPNTLFLRGVSDLGSVKASILGSVEPVSAAVISTMWLHSAFTGMDLLGFASILATVFLLAHPQGQPVPAHARIPALFAGLGQRPEERMNIHNHPA